MMKRVLVTPLDWGLGHATRCIPVIRKLLDMDCTVFIAGNGSSLELLKAEFPLLTFLTLTGYEPRYPASGSMALSMLSQLPKFFRTIRKEHLEVDKIIREQKIDVVISDNRYGCWTERVPCVFITHQSNILMPKRFGWLSSVVRKMNERFMRKFSVCWIPDFPDGKLSGSLLGFGKFSDSIPFEFIGSLSRFKPLANCEKKYDVTAILSGPEPQRTIFEGIVLKQLMSSSLKYCVVRGVPSLGKDTVTKTNMVDFLASDDLQSLLCHSELVIARSGYSTIMDMAALGHKAILVPTPGQTEQEYLARELKDKRIVFSMAQKDFNLHTALDESKKYTGFIIRNSDIHLLENALNKLINR